MNEKTITVSTFIKNKPEVCWNAFTNPEHITQWNFASPDWHCPKALNDLKEGGAFSYTMAARDGSMSFDLTGKFSLVKHLEKLHYTLDDGRKVEVLLESTEEGTQVTQRFEPESMNSPELQRMGWQSILDNYGKYTEQL